MKTLKFLLIPVLSLLCVFSSVAQTKQTLSSPDGNIKVEVTLAGGISYDVYRGDELVLDRCRLSMDISGNVLGSTPKLQKATRRSVNEVKKPFLRLKYAEVPNNFNELTLKFKGGYSLIFRAYDDGMAYRWVTEFPGQIEVNHEDITVFFPAETQLVLQQSERFRTSYEEFYTKVKASDWKKYHKMSH